MVVEMQGHCCLVFECLGRSLYDYLKKNDYRGFPMSVLRPIARELLQVSQPGEMRLPSVHRFILSPTHA